MRLRTIAVVLLLYIMLSAKSYGQNHYAKTLLWEISGKDLSKSSYLYGTFHINHEEVFNLNDSVLSKLVSCDAFANEFNADSVSFLLKKLYLENSGEKKEKKVSELLSKNELKRLDNFLRKKKKISLDALNDPPAFEVYMRTSAFGFSTGEMSTMLDGWLYDVARSYKKKIFGLEDLIDSYNKLFDIPEKEQRDMLISIMDSSSLIEQMEDEMLKIYLSEDLDGINALVKSSGSEFTKDILLTERNHNMAENIKSAMKNHSCFFAVGVAHLPGIEGLIDLLSADGYTVTPVIAPKTGHYKSLVKENSNVSWEKFTDLRNGYSLEMPGKPVLMDFSKFNMNGYLDIGTGKIYLAMALPLDKKLVNAGEDELYKDLEKKFSKKGKVKNKHTLNYKGFSGVEMDISNEDAELRMRLLRNNSLVYLFIMGGQSFAGSSQEPADHFFNSVNFFPPVNNYKEFISDSGAFSVFAPDDFKLTASTNEEKQHSRTYSSVDKTNKITFAVSHFDYGYGRYFDDLEKVYDLLAQSFSEKMAPGFEKKDFDFLGYPARKFIFSSAAEGFGEIIYVLRESRLYIVVALCESAGNLEKVNTLISSFRFIPYMNCEFKKYHSPQNDFTVLFAPLTSSQKVTDEEEVKEQTTDTTTNYHYSLDLASGCSYTIISERYGKYYYTSKKDSAFFHDMMKALSPLDSVMNYQFHKKGKIYKAQCKVEFAKNKNYTGRYLLALNGETLYTASCFQPATVHGDSIANVFFNSFTILKESKVPHIFSSKLEMLLNDLCKSDTSQLNLLTDELTNYDVTATDTSVLKKSLSCAYVDDTSKQENVRYYIYQSLFNLLSDSIECAKYVTDNYEKMGENPHVKILALSKLANTSSEENYLRLKQYLIRDKPKGSNNYSLYTLLREFYMVKNPLAKILYPEFLELASDSLYKESVYYTTYRLMDHGVLSTVDLAHLKENLLQEARKEFAMLAGDSVKNENNYSELMDDIMHILNYFNDEKILTLNKDILEKNFYEHYDGSVKYLANHNIKPDEKLLEKCLAGPMYRWQIYNALDTAQKISWFPAKFLKQRFFAESDLYEMLAEDEGSPDEIKFLETFPVQYKNEKKLMCVFKIFYKDETDKLVPYLAWAGPYLSSSNNIDVNGGEWTGTDYDKWEEKTYREKLKLLETKMNED